MRIYITQVFILARVLFRNNLQIISYKRKWNQY